MSYRHNFLVIVDATTLKLFWRKIKIKMNSYIPCLIYAECLIQRTQANYADPDEMLRAPDKRGY